MYLNQGPEVSLYPGGQSIALFPNNFNYNKKYKIK
jgi:hypothetical protein